MGRKRGGKKAAPGPCGVEDRVTGTLLKDGVILEEGRSSEVHGEEGSECVQKFDFDFLNVPLPDPGEIPARLESVTWKRKRSRSSKGWPRSSAALRREAAQDLSGLKEFSADELAVAQILLDLSVRGDWGQAEGFRSC